MNLDRWIEVLLAAAAVWAGYISYRFSTRAFEKQASAQAKAVDAEAYRRAQMIYEGAIEQLNAEVRDLRGEVTRLKGSNGELAVEVAKMHVSNMQLSAELARATDLLRRQNDSAAPDRDSGIEN